MSNSSGGKLVIGVGDDKAILGLETDFQSLSNIRRSARMRSREESDEDGSMRQAFAEFSGKLEPTDLIAKHRWLFAQHYVQESWDEITNERLDFEEGSRRIEEKRENAVREIWHAQG